MHFGFEQQNFALITGMQIISKHIWIYNIVGYARSVLLHPQSFCVKTEMICQYS